MIKSVAHIGLPMHILGISMRSFVTLELPVALKYKVRGVDSCLAFTTGVRSPELLNQYSTKKFIGNFQRYKELTKEQVSRVTRNMLILESFVKGEYPKNFVKGE